MLSNPGDIDFFPLYVVTRMLIHIGAGKWLTIDVYLNAKRTIIHYA